MARFNKALAQLMQQEGSEPRPQMEGAGQSQSVLAELRRRASTDEFALAEPFFDTFLRNARLLEPKLSTNDVAAMTLGAFRFLCDRHTSAFTLRSFTPSLAEHGWSDSDLVIEIATLDQPSLVDSLCTALERQGASIEVIISAVVDVERNETGMVQRVTAGDSLRPECLLHLQLTAGANQQELEGLLRGHLDRLARGRRDERSLQQHLVELGQRLQRSGHSSDAEAADLLGWLHDHMTLAGYQEEGPASAPGTRSLGTYLNPPPELAATHRDSTNRTIAMRKTRAPDPLHSGAFLDEIEVRPQQPADDEANACRIAGSLGTRGQSAACSAVPVARRKLAELVEIVGGAVSTSTLTGIFDSLPTDLALAADPSALATLLRGIAEADAEPSFRAHLCDRDADTCELVVSAPRQHLARGDAERVAGVIAGRVAPVLATYFVADELNITRLHCTLATPQHDLRADFVDDSLAEIRKLLSSWSDRPVVGEGPGGESTPPSARTSTGSPVPLDSDAPAIAIAADPAHSGRALVTAQRAGEVGEIHQLLSLLADFGLPAVALDAHRDPAGPLGVTVEANPNLDFDSLSQLLSRAATGELESDPLNALSHTAEIAPATLCALRGLAAWAEHLGVGRRRSTQRAMAENPTCTAALARAIEVRFDPRLPMAGDGQRKREIDEALLRAETALRSAAEPRHTTVLRALADLVSKLSRTTLYCRESYGGDSAIAFKLEDRAGAPAAIETFVYARDWEGALARGGRAARASVCVIDDPQDLYTTLREELADQRTRAGYLATNPGAAVLAIKRTPIRPALLDASWRVFLETLLDLTDRLDGEVVRTDDNIIAYDEADPYLSLIIGEQRAGLGEIASQVVGERGFWLGEAAVTRYNNRVAADGAWASIESLLPSFGTNEPPTVVAIGKPHQLNLPPNVRLVAAFDESEIFLDPHCDAKRSGEALVQLSKRTTSAWSDFPSEARGNAATVVARDAASVDLADEIIEWLADDREIRHPDDLLRQVLGRSVDLLWACSPALQLIADGESGSNSDRLAVPVSAIAAAAIAEPTASIASPSARIAFARAGGIVHGNASDGLCADLIADRVSNVDLAISLIGDAPAQNEIGTAEVAAEIRQAAMEIPPRHAVAIALDQRRSRLAWNEVESALRSLVADPDNDPAHRQWSAMLQSGSNDGLSRPEIVLLRSATGERLQSLIVGSALAEDPYLSAWIDRYFPNELPTRFPQAIDRHPLRQEIAAVAVTDRLLDVMGAGFVPALAADRSCSELDAIKTWCAAFIFGGAQEVWAEIENAKASLSDDQHQRHRVALAEALFSATKRLVELRGRELGLDKLIDRFGNAAGELLRGWPEVLPEDLRAIYRQRIDTATAAGLSEDVADHLARIGYLTEIVDICDLAIRSNAPRSTVASVYLALDPLLSLTELSGMIEQTAKLDRRWGRRAAIHMADRLTTARRDLTAEIVSSAGGRKRPVETYAATNAEALRNQQDLVAEVRAAGSASPAAVETLIGEIERLAGSSQRSWQR